jgi:hypothetical protein
VEAELKRRCEARTAAVARKTPCNRWAAGLEGSGQRHPACAWGKAARHSAAALASWVVGCRRLCDHDGRRRGRSWSDEGSGVLAPRGVLFGPGGHVHVAEHVPPVAGDGVLQAARVLVHEPFRVRAALLVPKLRDVADLNTGVVHDVLDAL